MAIDGKTIGPAANPAFNRPGPHLVVRDFFGAAMVARLLEFAASNRSAFGPSSVSDSGATDRIDPSIRISNRI